MNGEKIVSAAVGGALTAVLAAAGLTVASQVAPPTVSADGCHAAVRRLAEVNAETAADASRHRCKYLHAREAATDRGWRRPQTAAEWDAICSGADEEAP